MSHEDMHPAGKGFRGTITDHGFSEAKSGSDQLFLVIRNNETDRLITKYLALTDAAIEWTVKQLRRAGYSGFSLSDLADGQRLVGNEVAYDVEHEINPATGATVAKVGWINDPNRVGIQRSQNAATNAARFDAVLKKFPPDQPAKVADDDIPF